MKLHQFSGMLIAATALLSVNVPAFANPFAPSSSSLFNNSSSNNSAGNASVGNDEIKGLGDHQSWINANNLAKDPRAMCDDNGLGNNTRSNTRKLATSNTNNSSSSSSHTHNDGGGGGVSVAFVSVNGNGSSQGSDNNSTSKKVNSTRTEDNSSSSSTVVQGKNCGDFVKSAALRDMNYQDNLTKRYEIKVGRRGQQVDTLIRP